MKIFVLKEGWVLVGEQHKEEELKINNASVIRKWGTVSGIGELKDGPLKSTVLDKLPGTVVLSKPVFEFEVKGQW